MTDRIASLTDKEKEVLRLLLAGHDAKSSANEIAISVHTVNDRLRNARRKLSVSSSREAARILGDAEGITPQISAHSDLGSAESGAKKDIADLTQTGRIVPSRTLWLAGGMLIMSVLIAIAVLATVSLDNREADLTVPEAAPSEAAAGAQAGVSADPDTAQSMARIERFLARVDAGDWEGSWGAAGPYFQSQVTADEWEQQIRPLRSSLGTVQSREVVSVQFAETLPGAPAGTYEVVQFETVYSGQSVPSVETVIALSGKDGWEVVGYFIR